MGINKIFKNISVMGQQASNNFASCEVNGTMMGEHLKSPSDITSMPYFPTVTSSLLSKCLTKDIWEKCKDRKDKYGYTFKQSIFSGAKWTKHLSSMDVNQLDCPDFPKDE